MPSRKAYEIYVLMKNNLIPVFDLHCDLLSYLVYRPGANAMSTEDIGCAIPHLQQGNVKLQVMAIYAPVEPGSADFGYQQSLRFKKLLEEYADYLEKATDLDKVSKLPETNKTGVVAAIENAAGFCEEHEPLDKGFQQLEKIISNVNRLLYISLTHHSENRFGGGNYCTAGLKEDGKVLLEYLSGRFIPIDLSHTCDALAFDIIEYIERRNLIIPLMASHSNFRSVFDHPRNLRDEIVKEIADRDGVIGINFLRAFLNDKNPEALVEHILYGLSEGLDQSLAFGADFFYTKDFPDPSREPFYFATESDASKFPGILHKLSAHLNREQLEAISYKNVSNFINRIWQ
jgi:membrane dipeptidase